MLDGKKEDRKKRRKTFNLEKGNGESTAPMEQKDNEHGNTFHRGAVFHAKKGWCGKDERITRTYRKKRKKTSRTTNTIQQIPTQTPKRKKKTTISVQTI